MMIKAEELHGSNLRNLKLEKLDLSRISVATLPLSTLTRTKPQERDGRKSRPNSKI